MIGEKVEFVYIEQEGLDKVIYIESDEENVTLIKSFNLSGYANNILSYYANEDAKRVSARTIKRGATVLYNGRLLNKSLSSVINELVAGDAKGTIKLIAANDKIAHTVVITSYKTVVANQFSEKTKTLYNSIGAIKEIDLSNCDNFVVRGESSISTSIGSSFPAVFGVAESDDGLRVELYSYDKTEVAVVSSVKQTSNIQLVLGDKTVRVDKKMYPNFSGILKAGNEVKLFYDMFGHVVYANMASQTDMNVGYICDFGLIDNIFDEKVVAFKIITAEGKIEMYELSDSVKIDGESYKNKRYTQIIKAFPGGVTEAAEEIPNQAIRYVVGADGKISKVDTYNKGAKEDEVLTLRRHLDGTRKSVFSAAGSSISGDLFDAETKFFIIPDNADGNMKENEYATSSSMLVDAEVYFAETYMFTDSFVADIVVIETEPRLKRETLYMFDEVGQSLNADEEICDVIYCWTGGTRTELIVAKECDYQLDRLNRGDLLQFDTNQSGNKIMQINRVYDVENGRFDHSIEQQYLYSSTLDKTNDYSWYNTVTKIIKTYAGAVKNNMLCSSFDLSDLAKKDYFFTLNIGSNSITVFDPNLERDPIFKGMQADILTYEYAKEMCDTVIVSRRTGTINSIFIIKNRKVD